MQQRIYTFLVVLLIFFSGNVFSQEKDSIAPRVVFVHAALIKPDPVRMSMVSPDFYSKHLTFFCKKELQLEKSTFIPFRFRLGSLEYTNYLEQKPNAIKPGN